MWVTKFETDKSVFKRLNVPRAQNKTQTKKTKAISYLVP